MSNIETHCDAFVIGRGPAGLVAALCLAHYRLNVVCAGPPFSPDPSRPDTRTTALLSGSVRLLQRLGAWSECESCGEPLLGIRIIDDTERLIRAPEILFTAAEIGLRQFGFNISNEMLVKSLLDFAHTQSTLTIVDTSAVTDIRPNSDSVLLTTSEHKNFRTQLVVGADGRNSPSRQAARISTKSWTYNQTAVACNLRHSRAHKGISTEFHTANGPFTVVPLPGNASSLVWVDQPSKAQWLMSLSTREIKTEIAKGLHGILGEVLDVGPRSIFPLSGLTAVNFAKNRIALVGEAGHVVPPIGAQGLNLAFRDAAFLSEAIAETYPCDDSEFEGHGLSMSDPDPKDFVDGTRLKQIPAHDKDIGDPQILQTYHSHRQHDVRSRAFAIDLLNRSLITDFIPLQTARSIAMHLIGRVPALKHLLMREGLGSGQIVPGLMRSPETQKP